MSRSKWCTRALILGASLLAFGGVVPHGYAQVTTAITPDATLGTAVSRTGNLYNINGGTITGANQFHSFTLFSVGTGDIASFNGPAGIQNIVSRVTGGVRSDIDGTLRSTIAGANLFLLNPAGILFGPNASLDIQGSFHATTADYIKLGADGIFFADPAKPTVLSVAPPSAFGFLTSNPAPIDVQAGVFNFTPPVGFAKVLQVPAGQTLSFVGGPVNVGAAPGAPAGGFLFAPQGRINLVSVASAGEATFDGKGFNVDGFARLGDISIKGNSVIDAKEVFIRGGRLVINGATIFPGIFFLAGAPVAPPNGGGVNIATSDSVQIIGQPVVLAPSGIQTFAGSATAPVPGDVPNITIKSPSVSISDGALVQTSRQGPGNPSNVVIEADTVDVRNGASVSLVNSFQGPGGTLTVNARDVTLDSAGSGKFTGFAAQANFHPAYGKPGVPFLPVFQLADSGSITINATGTVTVRGSAQISTDSFAFGKSGNITVNAGDMLLVGAGTNTAGILAQSGLAGQSGDVTINAAGSIEVQNGFRIGANTLGSGDGGQANVRAGRSITMSGASTFISAVTDQPLDSQLTAFARLFSPFFQFFFGVATPDYPSLRAALGVAPHTGDLMQVLAVLRTIRDPAGNPLVAVTDFTPGTGGRVSIATPALTANSGARIETSTAWDGNAGAVVINVGSLTLSDGAFVGSRSGAVRLDRGPTVGAGSAGTVNIVAADTISISGGSDVTTSTFGGGNAGDISLSANQVNVQSSGKVTSDSGGILGGQLLAGSGKGGNINIAAPQINLLDGATISATSQGTASALAGSVNIVTNNLTMRNASITTQSALADGGNITVTTNGSQVYLLDSQITTSVQSGVGTGGNITVGSGDHPVEFVILNNGQIRADAFGGPGGNISIFADTFLTSGSVVSASSALAAPGVIDIQAKFTNLSGNITQLPETVLQAASLLRAACAARLSAGKSSSLVVAGRDGVPLEPGGVMPSPLIAETSSDLAPSRAEGEGRDLEPVPAAWRVSLRSKCAM